MTTPSSAAADLPRTITVTGVGRVAVRPDIAELRLGVTVTESTVDAARAASAGVQQAVLAKLKELGVAERDLRTSIVSVSPQYDYSQQSAPPRLVGYQFSNVVAATLREIDKVGDAIDAALGAGATTIDGLDLRVADQSAAETAAREAAVADARARAETLAHAAGVVITGVLSISEGGAPPIPYPRQMEMAAFSAKDAGTPIEPGVNEITASATIAFVLGTTD